MESIIKDLLSTLKNLQGLIGVLIGWWIASRISKKDRLQKDRISESERIDKYRLSAIDKRMEVHQKAYELWYYLTFVIHKEEIAIEKSNEARKFWVENCLYLTPKCRSSFNELIQLVSLYKNTYWHAWKDADPGNEKVKASEELKNTFNKIMSVGKIIQEEVDISYTEPESISKLRKEENEKLKT